MAIEEPISAHKAPRFPPLPGSLAACAATDPAEQMAEALRDFIAAYGACVSSSFDADSQRFLDMAFDRAQSALADHEA